MNSDNYLYSLKRERDKEMKEMKDAAYRSQREKLIKNHKRIRPCTV